MREEDLEAFTQVALFLAEVDGGGPGDSELRVILGVVAKLGADHGMQSGAATRIAVAAAKAYVRQQPPPSLGQRTAAFEACVEHLQVNVDTEALPRLYRELVQVAASDGDMGAAERAILAELRLRWALLA